MAVLVSNSLGFFFALVCQYDFGTDGSRTQRFSCFYCAERKKKNKPSQRRSLTKVDSTSQVTISQPLKTPPLPLHFHLQLLLFFPLFSFSFVFIHHPVVGLKSLREFTQGKTLVGMVDRDRYLRHYGCRLFTDLTAQAEKVFYQDRARRRP